LDDGRFNCVSATILFNYLAGEVGLECRGVAVPGHVMSRVILPDGKLDLETTCPTWFQVLADPQKRAAARTRHADAAQAADHAKPQEVSPIQMAAMVYYNRGVDLLGVKKFSEAAVVNAKAVRLDPQNATARGNLLATLNNWSIELGGDGRFREAVEVLHQGLLLEPKYEAFAQNYVHVHRQWADSLCRTGHLGEAMEVLTEAVAEMPDQPYLRQVQGEVSQRLAQSILNQQNDPETPAAPAAATN
jgi:tetratricopeptide (TPR) repeat protein